MQEAKKIRLLCNGHGAMDNILASIIIVRNKWVAFKELRVGGIGSEGL
jgi:hypothetical protein